MLALFSKLAIPVTPGISRSKQHAYSTARTLSFRLLPRPRIHPQVLHGCRFATKSAKPRKPPGEVDITPTTAPQNLPGANTQPRLLERLKSAGVLSDLKTPPRLSHFQRLFSPLLFTLAVCGGSYYYAQNWKPTPIKDRWFPDLPQSLTTVAAIIAVNCAVFLAWKVPLPMTWRLLNRYFISVPAVPYSLSIIGSVFSHQTILHLGMNMFVLFIFGSSLCDQIGRGNFLGLYFSAGAISSFTSLACNVLRSRFHIYALGASGAISGVIGAFTYFNPDRELYFIFLPFMSFQAYKMVTGLALLEVVGILRGWTMVDHVAHLSGMLWGVGYAYWKNQEFEKRRELARKKSGWRPI